MAQTDFDRVVALARSLGEDDQIRLRDLLDSWLGVPPLPRTEEEFDQELLQLGVLDQVPTPTTDDSRFRDYKPVEVEGEPVSETIIKERR